MSSPTTTSRATPDRSRRRPASSITPVAWIPGKEIDLAEWSAIGRRLGAIGRCGQWGLGDWIRYGNAKFGERYTRAARLTGYDVQTLTNMVYVASRFEISRRRENLSWSHHETLAALDPSEQDRWLDRAASERLSISDLRLELRRTRRDTQVAEVTRAEPGGTVTTDALVCPHCGKPVPLPAGAAPGSPGPVAGRET